jgi:hypothetical protein
MIEDNAFIMHHIILGVLLINSCEDLSGKAQKKKDLRMTKENGMNKVVACRI